MRLTIEPTEEIISVGGFPCRRWIGVDDCDVPVEVMVRCLSPQSDDPAVRARYQSMLQDLGYAEPTVADGVVGLLLRHARDGG